MSQLEEWLVSKFFRRKEEKERNIVCERLILPLIMKSTDCVSRSALCRPRGHAQCSLKENSNITDPELIKSFKKKKLPHFFESFILRSFISSIKSLGHLMFPNCRNLVTMHTNYAHAYSDGLLVVLHAIVPITCWLMEPNGRPFCVEELSFIVDLMKRSALSVHSSDQHKMRL